MVQVKLNFKNSFCFSIYFNKIKFLLKIGLGIGSSFGIYDNIYPNTISASKSTGLRRKLVPGEGIILLADF